MTGKKLQTALSGLREELEEGLAEAEAELAQLETRREDLLTLIAQAKAALGINIPRQGGTRSGRGLTLHEAITHVLEDRGNTWMTARELADEVNGRKLYYKRDGSLVETNQIHARVNNYPQLFEKDGSRIRLRSSVA